MEPIECKEFIKVEDGSHVGVITKVVRRLEPHDYTDVFVSLKEGKVELKAGYPSSISKKTSLGRLLERFDVELKVGEKYDPEALLVGKKAFFMTLTSKTDDGSEYSNVIRESLKLHKELGDKEVAFGKPEGNSFA